MSLSRLAGAGVVAAVCAFSSLAHAEQGLQPGDLLVVKPNGQISTLAMENARKIEMMRKEGEVVNGPVMIMEIDGKTYILKDHKMANGRMAFDWFTHEGTN